MLWTLVICNTAFVFFSLQKLGFQASVMKITRFSKSDTNLVTENPPVQCPVSSTEKQQSYLRNPLYESPAILCGQVPDT